MMMMMMMKIELSYLRAFNQSYDQYNNYLNIFNNQRTSSLE